METVSSKGQRVIVVFSKSADHGNVKTRLRAAIGDHACMQLHLAMLQDTLECCMASRAQVVLHLAGENGLPFPVPLPVRSQVEGDLGQRMQHAFQENLQSFEKVLMVGSDAPGLTPSLLQDAFAALEDHDLVLGPSEDGGYYLIGLRKMIDGIFEDIPWGTSEVFSRTLERIPEGTAHFLPRLWDIDLPADLVRLEREIESMPHARHLQDWIASRKACND